MMADIAQLASFCVGIYLCRHIIHVYKIIHVSPTKFYGFLGFFMGLAIDKAIKMMRVS